ncbi:MAG: TOBE domain-containing protein, partial [Deltaproteobacteria bacterium]
LRVHMRSEIRALHDRLGATSVYVTHDQIEAMTMADHVVVMRQGVIEQQGAPMELYDSPANKFVAGFIGSPAMNFIQGQIGADGHSVTLDLPNAPVIQLARKVEAERKVTVGIRPEHLHLDATEGQIEVGIRGVESTGSMAYYTTKTEPEIMLVEQGRSRFKAGDMARLRIAPENVHLFDRKTDLAI